MCTRVMWPDAGGAVLVGRNMDFHKDLMTNLWKQPRGVARDDGVTGALRWTSKYGSVIAAAFDIISVDGLNEAGLAGHVLWLAESTYGTPDVHLVDERFSTVDAEAALREGGSSFERRAEIIDQAAAAVILTRWLAPN